MECVFVAERRENEIKARAYKERKAQQSKENRKTLPQKSKPTDSATGKQKQIEAVKVKKLSVRNRRLPLQKPEYVKNTDNVKSSLVPDIVHKKESFAVKESVMSKKQDGARVGLQMRPRKIPARLQSTDNHSHEEGGTEVDTNKMKSQCAPRRSLRRGSRETSQELPLQSSSSTVEQGTCDIIEQASSSEIASADTIPSKNLTKKSKLVPPLLSAPSVARVLRKFSKSRDNNFGLSEETFSDSDEEPLGKLALKHSSTQKFNEEVNVSKDAVIEHKSETGEGRDHVIINKKFSKNEGLTLVLGSDSTEKNNIVAEKTEQVLNIPVVAARKGNEKVLHQLNDDISKVKVMHFSNVIVTRNKEFSQIKREDDGNSQNAEVSHTKTEENVVAKDRGLPHRSELVNSKCKEKQFKKNEFDNIKKKEALHTKNEESTFTKNKELPSKKSDIERSEDVSNKKSEKSESVKSKEMSLRESDSVSPKNKEVSLRKGEVGTKNEVLQRKTRDCVNARYKEVPQKRSTEDGTEIEELSIKEAEDDSHTKKTEMILRSCEEDHLITKTNETSLKKDKEAEVKSTEISQQITEDDLNKMKKIIPGRKSENSNSRSKEVVDRNCEEDHNTKNIGVPLKKCDVLSVKSKIYITAKTEDIAARKSEESNSKNKEALQRKNEHGTTKNKQFEDDILTKNKEILSNQKETLSITNEITPRNAENRLKNVETQHRKNENFNTKVVKMPSENNEVCCTKIEVSELLRDDRYVTLHKQLKSECVCASDVNSEGQAIKHAPSLKRVEPLTKGKIIIKSEEVVGEVTGSKEEKLEPCKAVNISNNVKITNTKLINEILCSDNVDIAQSSHVLKSTSFELKTEPQTVKTELETVKVEKQTGSNVSNISSSSNTVVPVSNKVNILNTEKKLPNMQMLVGATILTSTDTDVHSGAVSHTGIKTSPKHAVDDSSDSEDDTVLKKLPRPKVSSSLLSNSVSTKKEEPLSKCPSSLVLPVTGTVLKQGNNIKTPLEHVLPKQLYRGENVAGNVETEAPMISNVPVVNRMGLTPPERAATTKSDNENREKFTHSRDVNVRKGENGSSSQTLAFHAKSNQREPTFRDKVKAKMNMSNEQIEKWLNESYIEEADSKNPMFDKCIDSIIEEGETSSSIDFMHSSPSKESDYRTGLLEEGMRSGKGTSCLREIDGEQLYKPDKNLSFLRDEFQQKVVELQEVTPQFNVNFKRMLCDVAPINTRSSVKSLLILDEGRESRVYSNRLGSLVKETESIGVDVIPNSQQRTEMSTRNQEEHGSDISREETAVGELQRAISSCSAFLHIESEPVMLGPSCGRTDRGQRSNQEKLTHNIRLHGDTHVLEEKVSKLNPETKKQEGNIAHHSIKSQPIQDRGGEKKSIFQQRRSFPHKVKERKDFTPSANAFSPENESSVYAFESEPELPPISTPFRRRARDSRTSSTTTSKSEEDLARLDDETTPPPSAVQMTVRTIQSPTVPTSAMQAVQSRQLTLPVGEQPIQTLPLSTAIVQIIPTLPITMRPVQAENLVTSQQQQQQQQQHHQQLLLLQNDAVMTTLKTGCTSSTSIAVQVNLDSEPSIDISSLNTLASDPAAPEPVLHRSMECSTQTDVAEEEEDDSEGHLFYIPLQHPSSTGGSLAAPAQQLIQGVAVKLGTEGPTGPNQRVIMRAKLVTKPPTFNRTAVGIQDGKTIGIGRYCHGLNFCLFLKLKSCPYPILFTHVPFE